MAKARKGGPKRKEGARDSRGRLLTQGDGGTPELRARKIAMTGTARDDMSTLGVLRGRRIIDDEHYEAGLEFERCYRAYIGRPDPVGSALERHGGGVARALDEGYMARMKTRYWNCLAALNQVGPHVFALVRDVCLYERSGGLMGQVIAFDIVRMEGLLISRRRADVPPPLRQRIGALVRGLEALDGVPRADYSREATQLIATLQARQRLEGGSTDGDAWQRSDSA